MKQSITTPHTRPRAALYCLLALLLAACSTPGSDPTPQPTAGLANPKSLATVYISPTPEVSPTPTAGPATPANTDPTPTPTPYVGVFLGSGDAIVIDINATVNPFSTVPPPSSVATTAPGGGTGCGTTVAPSFELAWNRSSAIQDALGCPINEGYNLGMVHQPFEHGHMFYRETGDIYAVSVQSLAQGNPTDLYWHLSDTWQEGQPENDPSLAPPDGLMQPVRGFGTAWRSTPAVRDALGWATNNEAWYDVFWQDFTGGWMMLSPSGQIFALAASSGGTGVHYNTTQPGL